MMCGIAGYLSAPGDRNAVQVLRGMGDKIAHRGPDDSGIWHDNEAGIGFTHRRLSVVDLSPAGHQPMVSASGRYVIIFNGELYNHLDLRKQLESSWRGHSDTETLLSGFEQWGVQKTVERAVGMFAIAVWSREEQTLTLIRDRFGEKPLYFGWQGETFLFGSELKALRVHPAFCADIDRAALCLYMRHNYIPAPYSIYKGIAKVQPGTLIVVSLRQRDPLVQTYWSAAQVAKAGVTAPFDGNATQAVDELELLLKEAVGQQMMADVPLGAFLSGGVDSSTIVALMQAQSQRKVKTFTIGFNEAGYNEAEHAKAVANHLGTDHTELYVTPDQAIAVIPLLPTLYDEPFSDSSQIPTFLVSRLARQHVTVSLSGDAGDELFCGYDRYRLSANLWRKLNAIPLPLRRFAARVIAAVSPQAWSGAARMIPGVPRFSNFGDKLHKGARVLGSETIDALYLGLVSHWDDPASVVMGGMEPTTLLTDNALALNCLDGIQRMMALDILTYLPDDILVKVDRAAMGISLETRVPFLDHRVAEFAWQLPQAYKLREGQTKWALRQVLYRYVPPALIERPKMGFGVPIDSWLRGPLREWAEDLMDEQRLHREGYFNPAPIRKKWAEHLSGTRNWQYHLWDVLMFQAWLENERATA